jgi:hypothetical protein
MMMMEVGIAGILDHEMIILLGTIDSRKVHIGCQSVNEYRMETRCCLNQPQTWQARRKESTLLKRVNCHEYYTFIHYS